MKLMQLKSDVVSEQLVAKSQLKLKRVRQVLTPDNIKQHYEDVVQALAYGLTLDDINSFMAHVSGTSLSAEEIQFHLELMQKALSENPELGPIKVSSTANAGRLQADFKNLKYKYKDLYDETSRIQVTYNNGKWNVYIRGMRGEDNTIAKKFDADKSNEALEWLQNQMKKALKNK